MRPDDLKTKIFLDSGNPMETREALALLGFLDGQTTNPSLVAKNPQVKRKIERGEKFGLEELKDFYKEIVREISSLIPAGSVSVEVYADRNTSAEEMLRQGTEMFSWIPNAHIKYPITSAGLDAAERSLAEGMRVNMTLCFTQQQAAAVYGATQAGKKGDVYISPFIGRLYDRKENGLDLVKNILRMYQDGDNHVEVLCASVRNLEHFFGALKIGSDIITSPLAVLKDWRTNGKKMPEEKFMSYARGTKIPYEELHLHHDWRKFNIIHELTDTGLEKFAADWNSLLR
ncbi:MAG: transaldolase [Candidatus Wildermuthbacteria bacterium RIFCSPHIGHO2_12_FULL_45_9]|uniref:Transaldolase n=1 Tax=Candidatus Wildermuthbacteria bacterium RIFCSPHIGHO2_02_FULL_45_25 TaxID=1802450 RepID=A0A1G2R3R8_9BACT|nr:MAG: transaldolase [Candidatus Wildermuthbacteria bacterium RIFCSPHIGHO2_01_FULL_45_20]OHA67505.1 MAG: transaldolase [Candidatus Wildermuthbacteria bacterium RIFCSPHIGHO2_02_FULL_45_25]OHA72117.1 MAG: transaldolase [Candidatus Wildermuthbacteria bacterium RIFCSPHIGHO2_12_FULL_45_9]